MEYLVCLVSLENLRKLIEEKNNEGFKFISHCAYGELISVVFGKEK